MRHKSGGKDKGLALVLEIWPGLAGILGIGWMYSGHTIVGISLLLTGLVVFWGSYIVLFLSITFFAAITAGLGSIFYCVICIIPVLQVGAAIVSTLMLKSTLNEG
ncbi:MAG: hypothetical protein DPW09_10245 [Anaerolineae bacterium]|nr:hypothetical protein [Anaerolineales bacterium]MCQ3973813.1 hypothetical protein [Anaerolineae bacterium]